MKKLIPFRKEIKFDSNLYEITSISLEHSLNKENNTVSGNFIVSGEYRVTETSINTLPFEYNLPFNIDVDDIYDISDSTIDVDDFYYEIINNNILAVNIEVKLDNIKEMLLERNDNMNIELDEANVDDINMTDNTDMGIRDDKVEVNNIEINDIDNSVILNNVDKVSDMKKSLFANLSTEDNYVNYRVYIVRENDNLDNIMSKYGVNKDLIEQYNDISNIKLGDKIIIPYVKD